jgi:hypothetical protein
MANIRVRVGQQDGVKIVASNKSVGAIKIENAPDVNTGARTTNTFLMFNGTEYVHVPASQILDLGDGTSDGELDYGSF